MEKEQIQAYKIDFDSSGYGLPGGVTFSHAFVVSETHNWNCYGRGKESLGISQALSAGQGSTYAKWASYIYGSNEGQQNNIAAGVSFPAAGLHERYDGVCHNAANRILALAGGDVSQAPGNALVLLMYGKYGFNIEKYIQSVIDAAAKVNAEQPGASPAISQGEIDCVVARIKGDTSGEVDTLEKEILASNFEEHLHLQNLTPDQQTQLRTAYQEFQAQRLAAFEQAESQNPNALDIQAQYRDTMRPVFAQFLTTISTIIGPEKFAAVYGPNPEEAIAHLLG
jgi:hypothetical protein